MTFNRAEYQMVLAKVRSGTYEFPEIKQHLHEAMDEIDRLRKIAVDKEEENRLLFSGLAACVISTGKDRLFIPYSILDKNYQVEIFRDPEQPMGYTVTAKLAEDSCK